MPPSGRYMPSSSERYDIYLRGPVRPPFLFSGAPGQMRWASASGRCRTDSPIAGRVGEKHFFSRIGAIRFGTSRAFPARTRVTFPSPEKSPKGRIREGPFRWGPSLMNPSPATTQRGLAPFGIPPVSPADCPGTPVYFTCAAEMNSALRQGFRQRRKRLYAGLPAGQPSTCPVVLRVLPGMRYTRIYQCPSLLSRRLGHLLLLHIECIAAKSV